MKITKEYLEAHGVEVEIATLHQPVHFPQIGASDKTISDTKADFKGAKKYLVPQGLYIVDNKGREYIIPSAAMGVTMLSKTTTEAKKSTKVVKDSV